MCHHSVLFALVPTTDSAPSPPQVAALVDGVARLSAGIFAATARVGGHAGGTLCDAAYWHGQ